MKAKLALLTVFLFSILSTTLMAQSVAKKQFVEKGYASINGFKMYYETYGEGEPIVLLHGAYMTIEGPMREMANILAQNRKVILTEFQAHGRTTDTDRDISYEALADDVVAILTFLKIDSTDVLGYSLGAGVAIQMAIRHPERVKKVIAISGSYSDEGLQPVFKPLVPTLTPAQFEGSIFKQQYDSLAPNPKHFPVLVEKLKKLDMTAYNWEKDYVNIKHPMFLIFGDADGTTMEHASKMLTKLGGGVMGDLSPMPNVRLMVLPYTTHVGVLSRINWFMPMVKEFLALR